jgi:hypothetical protein
MNKPSDNLLFKSDDPELNARLDESDALAYKAQVKVNVVEAIRENLKKAAASDAEYKKVMAEIAEFAASKK